MRAQRVDNLSFNVKPFNLRLTQTSAQNHMCECVRWICCQFRCSSASSFSLPSLDVDVVKVVNKSTECVYRFTQFYWHIRPQSIEIIAMLVLIEFSVHTVSVHSDARLNTFFCFFGQQMYPGSVYNRFPHTTFAWINYCFVYLNANCQYFTRVRFGSVGNDSESWLLVSKSRKFPQNRTDLRRKWNTKLNDFGRRIQIFCSIFWLWNLFNVYSLPQGDGTRAYMNYFTHLEYTCMTPLLYLSNQW